ncbi:MAG: PD-(D/E)XK nuclease family protein [Ignavibacteriales bacterium]|nr:PD-(D/E)XK nuclease family protein [Ignavibacteriales bacterium]
MSRHVIISPAQNLIHEVASRLKSSTNDFSSSIVVFPGKRPAHFVRKALAERIRGSFIPPRIFSIDSFVEYLVSDKLGLVHKPLDNFDAVALLFDIHVSLAEHLGGEHFNSIDRFIGLGLKLYTELEELVMADVSMRRVFEALEAAPLGRMQALPDYFGRFYAVIEEKGSITRALYYRKAAEQIDSIDLSSHQNILFAGFYAYTELEQRILTSLLRRKNSAFIAQQGPGLKKHVQALGIDADDVQSPDTPSAPACYFYKASDTHGQVFAVSHKIKAMLASGTPIDEKTAIILPTADALFPVVHQTLPLLPPDRYNIALGYPLQRTPLFGFLSNLMDLGAGARGGDVPAREYTTFVLHPYTKNIRFGQRSDVTRVLFHALEKFLAETQSRTFVSLESLEKNNVLLDGVRRSLAAAGIEASLSDLQNHLQTIHDRTIRQFLDLHSLGDFAARAVEILQYIYKQSTATRHRFFHPYAQRFIELFESIRMSLLAPHRFGDPSSYFAFLRNAVASEEVPFSGTPLVGLQVLGLLETRNLSFDTVFLLNATDDVIPGTRGNDVLLPQPFREKLGLETYRQRERLIEYYVSILFAGARTVHCFFTESGNHEKSRFLEKLLWEEQQKKKSLDIKDLIQVVRYNVQLATASPDAIEKTHAVLEHLEGFEYTATSLDTWLTCQLKFYYAHVLKLSEKDEVADDIDQLEVGSFVHDVLSAFFKKTVGNTLTPADLDLKRLRQLIDTLYEEKYGSDLVGASYLVKQQLIRQLEAFISGYQMPRIVQDSVKILGLEESIAVNAGGFSFTGRIDRIEQRGARHVILDYKTGRDDSHVKINIDKLIAGEASTWHAAIGSFQLPMYMLLYSEAKQVPISSILPAFLFLGRNEITPDIETGIGGASHTAAEVYEAVRPVLFGTIQQILDPTKRFEPTEELHKACPRCPYRALCGTSWVGG